MKEPVDFYLDCENEKIILVDEDMKDVKSFDIKELVGKMLKKEEVV